MSLDRFKKIGLAGVLTLLFSLLLKFAIVPPIMRSEMKRKIALKRGWPMRDTWSKLPFVVESHFYIFNVTNHMEIANGAKPIVQEIGPFVYDMRQEKMEQVDYEEDDTVSYILRNVYHFNEEKSKGLSDEMEVYLPHTYIMTMSGAGDNKERGPYASFASRSVDAVLNRPESLFYKAKVKIPLFDGHPIPCGGASDYFAKLTCNVLRERYFDFALKRDAADTFYTSMFGSLNGTYVKQNRVRIKRGIENLKDVGKVIEIGGISNLSMWKDHECDQFVGTDGTIFPPIKGKADITIVNQFLCRKLKLTYDSEVEFSGLNLHRYTIDMGTDGDNVPRDKCYCIAPDRCLKKGMYDSYRCTNVPVIFSNPHFYLADPYYLTRVDTLKPDKEKHLTYIDFDPFTGSPVRAHARAQLNMELLKIDEFRLMRNYSYSMLPMVWVEEIVVLPDFLLDEIKFGHKSAKIVKTIEYTMLICGLAMCALAAYLNYKSKKVVDLKPTTPSENKSAGISNEIGLRAISEEQTPVATPNNI